jgi:hypothetical protein
LAFELGDFDVLSQAADESAAAAAMITIDKRFILGFSEPSSVNFLRDVAEYTTPHPDRFSFVLL